MASDISVGLGCPACGGAIKVDEGESVAVCEYCNSTLYIEGDMGIHTIAFRNKMDSASAVASTGIWWRRGWKARDLKKLGKILECYPIYLPFWSTTLRVAGWICGYEERRYTDSKGNVRVQRIPKEEMILRDYLFSEIACDPGDLGIKNLKNFGGEKSIEDFEMIPTFESTTSKDDAVVHAKQYALGRARRESGVPNITFERVHVFPKKISMIYYPVWIVRYSYKDRMYMGAVDGVTGDMLSGRAPGDPLFQSLIITAGTSVGGLLAAAGILLSTVDIRITIGAVAVGVIILAATYLFFRHGSEIVEGDFKRKTPSVKKTIKDMTELSSFLRGGLA